MLLGSPCISCSKNYLTLWAMCFNGGGGGGGGGRGIVRHGSVCLYDGMLYCSRLR